MEASTLLSCSSFYCYRKWTRPSLSLWSANGECRFFPPNHKTRRQSPSTTYRNSLFSTSSSLTAAAGEPAVKPTQQDTNTMPKIDKSGRFCSPRAAREFALSVCYAACMEGSDPVRLFDKRINSPRGTLSLPLSPSLPPSFSQFKLNSIRVNIAELGYEFNKKSLREYNFMSFGGPPVTTTSTEEADLILQLHAKQSALEEEVLSAPPKLVYSKLLLRFTRKLLVAVVDCWDKHVDIIEEVAPTNWKNEPTGRILEFCILHLAMSEIAVLGTRHQIVINEAVDLAKRFCDGAAPRIINGCLRTYTKGFRGAGTPQV